MEDIGEIAQVFESAGIAGLFLLVAVIFIVVAWKPSLEYLKIVVTTREQKFIDALEAQRRQFEIALEGKTEQIELLKIQINEIKIELEDYRNRYFSIVEESQKNE